MWGILVLRERFERPPGSELGGVREWMIIHGYNVIRGVNSCHSQTNTAISLIIKHYFNDSSQHLRSQLTSHSELLSARFCMRYYDRYEVSFDNWKFIIRTTICNMWVVVFFYNSCGKTAFLQTSTTQVSHQLKKLSEIILQTLSTPQQSFRHHKSHLLYSHRRDTPHREQLINEQDWGRYSRELIQSSSVRNTLCPAVTFQAFERVLTPQKSCLLLQNLIQEPRNRSS